MKPPPRWQHNKKLQSQNVVGYLTAIKDRLQDVIKHERQRIDHMVGVRDSVKKR